MLNAACFLAQQVCGPFSSGFSSHHRTCRPIPFDSAPTRALKAKLHFADFQKIILIAGMMKPWIFFVIQKFGRRSTGQVIAGLDLPGLFPVAIDKFSGIRDSLHEPVIL